MTVARKRKYESSIFLTQGHTPNVGDEAIYLSEKEMLEKNGFDVIRFPFW